MGVVNCDLDLMGVVKHFNYWIIVGVVSICWIEPGEDCRVVVSTKHCLDSR